MVRNREELLRMSTEWMNMAKTDLRRQVIHFMETVGTSETELAHALCISVDELNNIINGVGEISLSTFAKLLIATDNVIEIKPLSETPLAPQGAPSRGNGRASMPQMPPMPFGGGIPMPKKVKRDKNGRFMRSDSPRTEIPSMDGMPIFGEPTMSGMPVFDGGMRAMPDFGMPAPSRFGGMPGVNKQAQPTRSKQVNIPSVPRRELVTTIVANGWDEEIDMMNSTSDELIRFLMAKGLTPEHFVRMANAQQEQNERPSNGGTLFNRVKEATRNSLGNGADETSRIMGMIQEELERNPQLLESVKKYMHM